MSGLREGALVVMDDARELTWSILVNWSDPGAAFNDEFANLLTAVITGRNSWPSGDLFSTY